MIAREIKFFLIALGVSLIYFFGINIFYKNMESFLYAQISQPLQGISYIQVPKKEEKLNVESGAKSATVLKINKVGVEKIIFEKEPEKILPIASLTKLMTALIVLSDSQNYDLSKTIVVSKEAASQVDVPEFGNLKEGEETNIENLLNLMLVYSSNDAAFALAEAIGVENFVSKMNQKSEELGLKNTHFVNPTGLDPEKINFSEESKIFFNYSTCADLIELSKYILKEFPIIFEISLGESWAPVEKRFPDLVLNNHLIGLKTGYTDEAGGCLILIREENGSYYLNVILGTESTEARIQEMKKLIEG